MTLRDAITHLEQLAEERKRDVERLVPLNEHAVDGAVLATAERIDTEAQLLTLGAAACRVLVRLCGIPADTDVEVPPLRSPADVERFVDEVQDRALCAGTGSETL